MTKNTAKWKPLTIDEEVAYFQKSAFLNGIPFNPEEFRMKRIEGRKLRLKEDIKAIAFWTLGGALMGSCVALLMVYFGLVGNAPFVSPLMGTLLSGLYSGFGGFVAGVAIHRPFPLPFPFNAITERLDRLSMSAKRSFGALMLFVTGFMTLFIRLMPQSPDADLKVTKYISVTLLVVAISMFFMGFVLLVLNMYAKEE